MPRHTSTTPAPLLTLLALATGCAPSDGVSTDYALPPGVEWVQPAPREVLTAGQTIELEVVVGDRDSDMSELSVTVLADERTVCAAQPPTDSGTVLCLGALLESEQQLTARVEDRDGREASATLPVEVVAGLPPVLSFQAEHDEGPYLAEDGVRIIVQATDAEDPPEALELVLESDVDGALPLGPVDSEGRLFAELNLSAANHRLLLELTDTAGHRTTGEIWVEVREESTPSCHQITPAEGTVVVAGTELWLEGRVDLLAGEERPVVSWDSDLDGRLAVAVVDGEGRAAMSISGLRQGTHTLLFEAGAPANCTARATVVAGAPPRVELSPVTAATAGEPFALEGTVSDGEDAPEDILVEVSDSAGTFLGSSRPSPDGRFSVDLVLEGSAVLTLSAEDTHEMRTEHTLAVSVFDD